MSKIEVDAIDKQSGSTLTIGGSGTTVQLGTGASQSGFGRTGTVDWQTSIKTSTFTAVNGEGYFVNTTGGAVTVNLPAGSVGAIVAIKDYAQTFDTNNCTVSADGSEKIENLTTDLVLNTEGVAVTLIYADATRGWQAVYSNSVTNTQKFVNATGGTITTVCTNFRVHTFTGPGTFCVSCAGNPAGSDTIDYLVIGGGGGGGGNGPGPNNSDGGGGGGAGGYRESSGAASGCYSISPRGACVSALPVTVTGYPVTVGGGGGGTSPSGIGSNGVNSVFAGTTTITATGGGIGGSRNQTLPGRPINAGNPGGSGGGAGGDGACATGGVGNTPPVSPAQGSDGGDAGGGISGSPAYGSGGGGGATGAGTDATPTQAGPGGAGATSSINGTPTARAGGGGGGGQGPAPQVGQGTAGGGTGGSNCASLDATAGTDNTGGGGGGGDGPGSNGVGKTGGSGIVIIRYKFQ